MGLRITLLTLFCATIISCRQAEKSNEIMKDALDVYLSSDLAEDFKVEKSLELTNRALEIDDQNISALTHKTTLLFRKKDIEGLLQTVDDLIKLRPDKSSYLLQKALYLDLKGNNSDANEYYERALSKCRQNFKTDSTDFNLLLEYVGLLEITGDTTSGGEVLTRMERLNLDSSQKEILSAYRTQVYKRQSLSMDKLRKYWAGEIGYEQVEEK